MSTTKEYWGNKEWYCHGKLHRDNDLPAFISARGDKEWYQHGKRHPDNGPFGNVLKFHLVFQVEFYLSF